MDRWVDRVALVTGASRGIGRVIASRLAKHGMKVVACARNLEAIQELSESNPGGVIVPMQCDLRNEAEILAMFDRIRRDVGGVDVCVNNAGTGSVAPLMSGSTEKWREMLDLNVLALCTCTRETVKSMKERGVDDGFIINIGSVAGHFAEGAGGLSFYSATKHAVATYSNGLATELKALKSHIRVMEISPGLVETEMVELAVGKAVAGKLFSAVEALSMEDIADGVIYGLSASPRAQIAEVIIRPVDPINSLALRLASSDSHL